jgi:hypothetical protein
MFAKDWANNSKKLPEFLRLMRGFKELAKKDQQRRQQSTNRVYILKAPKRVISLEIPRYNVR